MKLPFFCLLTLVVAGAAGAAETVYHQSQDYLDVVRGEGPATGQPYEDTPGVTPNGGAQSGPTFVAPGTVPNGTVVGPQQYQPLAPGYDPFLGQQGGFGPQGPGRQFGANGPQPYQLNRWVSRYDFGYMPKEPTERGLGQMSIFEFDAEWEYSTPFWFGYQKIFTFTQEFGMRLYDGPTSSPILPGTALPGQAFHIGWDLAFSTPANGPFSYEVAFNPSINSDFEETLTSDAWNWDGRIVTYWRVDPYMMIVLGAEFWDRVHGRVVPHAGVVWLPDDRWELRLVFPEPRISYFLGNSPMGFGAWVYVRGEYHVEAYETQLETTGMQDQYEIEDWRVLLGVRKQYAGVSTFLEAGWVFGREVDYERGTPGFDISSGLIVRGGVRY